MGQTHTLAKLLTILFHTLEQVGTSIGVVAYVRFGVIFRFRAGVLKHIVRGFVTFKLPKIEVVFAVGWDSKCVSQQRGVEHKCWVTTRFARLTPAFVFQANINSGRSRLAR